MVKKQFNVFALLLVALLQIWARQISAQTFLTCSPSDYRSKPDEKLLFEARGEIKSLLYALTGDDAKAFTGSNLEVYEFDSTSPNAFSLAPNRIFLTSGLLEIIHSSSELAFVLAHELAHLKQERREQRMYLSGTGYNAEDKDLLNLEIIADLEASRMLRESGLDSSSGSIFLRRIKELSIKRASETAFFQGLDLRIQTLELSAKASLSN